MSYYSRQDRIKMRLKREKQAGKKQANTHNPPRKGAASKSRIAKRTVFITGE